MKIDYSQQVYTVSNREGFTLNEALCLWKTKYTDLKDLKKDIIIHESLEDFGNFIEEMWDDIKPATVQQALARDNAEERRVYFDCIGIQKLFKELEPVLLDRQVLTKKRTKWDDKDDPVVYEFECHCIGPMWANVWSDRFRFSKCLVCGQLLYTTGDCTTIK